MAAVSTKNGLIVISCFTFNNQDHSWGTEQEGELTIAKLAKAIVEAWSPTGIDGKTLVPGLGLSAIGEAGASK